jgi:N-acylneuraminate cytidylyltransferase
MLFPEHFNTRSQDLPEVLHDAGQFYWGRPESWIGDARIFDSNSTIVHIPRWRVQDIDTEEDWTRAESMATYLTTAK